MADSIKYWLDEIGLGEFSTAFEENGVDLKLLPELNNDDLKDMGVARVADRKRILNAIAELAAPVSDMPTQAQRRQLSVMFCDLVASTELSARLDPEDMRDVLRAYQDTAAGCIQQQGGYVANYLGDGVLAYFGWPTAYEDQAARAVRAALEAVQDVGKILTPDQESLAARVGIATGQVVVGDLDTEAGLQSAAISGDTPNRAARIQAEAKPGEIFIDASTERLIGVGFHQEDKGRRNLKGIAVPEQIWCIRGETPSESRFAAQQQGRLTPFVGRDKEINKLSDYWQRARGGKGQAVTVSGEAGIGKSRLTAILRKQTERGEQTILQFQCAPMYANSAFYPFAQQIAFAAGLEATDTDEAKLAKLETVAHSPSRPAAQTYAILAALFQIQAGDRYPPLNMVPDRLLEETGTVLVEQLQALASQQPVLMIFEDLHWIDASSLALLSRLVGEIPTMPVLLVMTYRPEFDPEQNFPKHCATLSLSRLTSDSCRDMIGRLSGATAIPQPVVDQILEKTDGVPLFVEELVQTVLEHKDLSGDDSPDGREDWARIAIPSTLQDSLVARLDRLSPVREIAQAGAVIGREFSPGLLSEITTVGENALQDALQQLVNAEIIYRRGEAPNEYYQFKHALVRDAAYDTMLKSQRRTLHKAVAETIEQQTPDVTSTQPELLAQHYSEAELPLTAIPLWIAATRTATARAAYDDAIAHAERGLALLSAEQPEHEISLLHARAAAVFPTRGYGDPEVLKAVARIEELSEKVEDSAELMGSLFWVSVARWNAGDLKGASAYFDRIFRIGEDSDYLPLRIATRGYIGSISVHLSEFDRSRELLEFVMSNYHSSLQQEIIQAAGQDLGINGMTWQAYRLMLEGYPDQGIALAKQAVELSRAQDHPFSFPLVVVTCCWVLRTGHEFDLVRTWAQEAAEYCLERQNPYWYDY